MMPGNSSRKDRSMRSFASSRLRAFVLGVGLAMFPFAGLLSMGKARGADDEGASNTVKRINEEIRRVWSDNQLSPSAAATDGEWCRRVYLDVLGRVPTVDEFHDFLTTRGGDKKTKLVNKLLYDEAYLEDYARNWTTIWTNILIGRNGGLERRSLINREGMQKYLRDSFARNKPYDKMVYELITAKGNTKAGEK